MSPSVRGLVALCVARQGQRLGFQALVVFDQAGLDAKVVDHSGAEVD